MKTLYANDKLILVDIPDNISGKGALEAVKICALNRKWSIVEFTENKLTIYLDHRKYRSTLAFTATKNRIEYTDFTLYQPRTNQPIQSSSWIEAKAPARWVNNLKKDVHTLLYKRSQLYVTTTTEAVKSENNIVVERKRITIIDGKYMLDGKPLDFGLFGGELFETLATDPESKKYAVSARNKYKGIAITMMPLLVVGLLTGSDSIPIFLGVGLVVVLPLTSSGNNQYLKAIQVFNDSSATLR